MKSAALILVCLLFVLPALAQNNALTVPAGGSAGGDLPPSTPTRVFVAEMQGADGNASPTGYAEFTYQHAGLSRVSVPARAAGQNGRIYAETGSATVGIAFDNPNTQEVTLSFFFTDANGVDSGSGSTIIPAKGQIARFLTEQPFNAPLGFRGTMTYHASSPVAVLAVRGFVTDSGLFLMPQVPVADSASRPSTIVPYFQDGTPDGTRSFSTELVLVNPADSALSGTFTFYDGGDSATPGRPVSVLVDGETRATFSYALPPRSSRRFATTAGSPFHQGSIQIQPSGGTILPFAFAILTSAQRTIGGSVPFFAVVAQTTIPGQAPGTAFKTVVRGIRIGGPVAVCCVMSTAFVIANPSDSAVGVSVVLPEMTATAAVVVPAHGQVVTTPQTIMAVPNGYGGTLRISSTTPVSVVALQSFINDASVVEAMEMLDESVPAPTPPVFPHLAEGGGFHTQLLLIKTADTQAANAVIRLYDQSGAPLDLTTVGFR